MPNILVSMLRARLYRHRASVAAGAVFLLIALLPVALLALSGPATAGISAGFIQPFQLNTHILLFFFMGLVASAFGLTGLLMVPVTFLLMLGIGALTDITMAAMAYARAWIFAFVLLYALAISVAYSRPFIVISTIFSTFAYFFGTRYMMGAPDIASGGYYLLGCFLGIGLVMACGISCGIVLQGFPALWRRPAIQFRAGLRRTPFLRALLANPPRKIMAPLP